MSIARRLTTGAAIALATAALPMALPAQAHAAAPASTSFTVAQARVTSSTLSVRTTPTTTAAKLATLHKGAWLTPVCSAAGQRVNGSATWYWVEETGGWVSAQYTKLAMGSVGPCSTFAGMHLMHADITSPAQVNTRLASTSPSFRAFIAKEAREINTGNPAGCVSTISVDGWWSQNQAIGSVGGCGGYLTVWTLKNGTWHETGWNGDVACSALSAAGATHAIPGNTGVTCYVRNGKTYVEKQFVPAR